MTPFENDIINSVNLLLKGGIILYPTDTIWGIGCDATYAEALQRIYFLKKREERKSIIILLASENDVKKYVLKPAAKIMDFLSTQNKPTTAIFDNAINLPRGLINDEGSVAIRIVKDEFCKMLIFRLNAPLVSTSANISGDQYPKNFREINEVIKNGVDYVVQHRQNERAIGEPSSIIRLGSDGEIKKLR